MIYVSENKEIYSIPLYSCCTATAGGVTETCAYDTDDFAYRCQKFENCRDGYIHLLYALFTKR